MFRHEHPQRPSAAEISKVLEERKLDVLRHLFPNGKIRSHEFVVGNLQGDVGDSLGVSLNGEGCVWKDFATGAKGGDLLDLWAQARCGGDIGGAMHEAASFLGVSENRSAESKTQSNPKSKEVLFISPIEGDAPPPPERHHELGAPTVRHEYLDEHDRPIFYVDRYEIPEGKKEFRPLTLWHDNGRLVWDWKAPPTPRPLYRLNDLARHPEKRVLIVEGEKAAEAAAEYFREHDVVAIAWPNGSGGIDYVDLQPLAGRSIVLWPDADESGQKAMARLSERLYRELGIAARIVQLPEGLSSGFDLADQWPHGWTLDTVKELIDRAPDQIHKTRLEPSHRIRAINLTDFLALDIPPREFVLEPVLPAQGLAMLFSKRGVGKTYTALGMAYAVATGGQFLRYSAPKAKRVLYIDGEMPAGTMRERIGAIIAGQSKDAPKMPDPEYLRFITPDLQIDPMPDLATREGQGAIEAEFNGAELVILDNLSTLCRLGQENESQSWQPVQDWALSLRRRGISVLFVHHAGKGGAQRGTSKREDVLDTIIALRHPADYSPADGARFEVHLEKARGICGDAAISFEAKMETRDGAAIWTVRDLQDVELAQAAELFRAGESVRDVAKALEISKSKAGRLRERAQEAGLLTGDER